MQVEIPDLDDIKFLEMCHQCYGTGRQSVYSPLKKGEVQKVSYEPCRNCEGKEQVLTLLGERLKEFLEFLGVIK
jgi:hypothetical protein